VASLWPVSDLSTVHLMRRFYRELFAGRAATEALRTAQLELLSAPLEVGNDDQPVTVDATHPYHWAAFVLIGDWK
jgi:CHAT domain-containing protein